MSSDAHGTLSPEDDHIDVSLDAAARRKVWIVLIVCSLFVIAVAIFVVSASENAGHVVPRVQDQRDAVVNVLQSVFA